jgi:hypothetical protein
MAGEKQTLYTPACLACGWIGDGTMLETEREGTMHLRARLNRGSCGPAKSPDGKAGRGTGHLGSEHCDPPGAV